MSLCAQSAVLCLFPSVDGPAAGVLPTYSIHVNEREDQQVAGQAAEADRDWELFQLIGAQDRVAFAEFYDRHCARLYSIAQRILNDATEAQDVVQDAFMQIWEKAGQFDPKLGRPAYWVVALVRNKAIDRVRASQRRARLAESAGAEAALIPAVAESAHARLHGHEKATLIRSAMVELPADQRHAIELAFFSGLTQDQISTQLSQPLGTIKARIRRGMLKLRDQLEGVL